MQVGYNQEQKGTDKACDPRSGVPAICRGASTPVLKYRCTREEEAWALVIWMWESKRVTPPLLFFTAATHKRPKSSQELFSGMELCHSAFMWTELSFSFPPSLSPSFPELILLKLEKKNKKRFEACPICSDIKRCLALWKGVEASRCLTDISTACLWWLPLPGPPLCASWLPEGSYLPYPKRGERGERGDSPSGLMLLHTLLELLTKTLFSVFSFALVFCRRCSDLLKAWRKHLWGILVFKVKKEKGLVPDHVDLL